MSKVTGRSPFDLAGRKVLVAGGNNGIGLAMALALASAGATVAVIGRNERRNAEALRRLREIGADCHAFQCDVTVQEGVDRAVDATLEACGRIDGCIFNAGVGGGDRRPFVERPLDDWRATFDVNVDAAFRVFQAVAGHMIVRHGKGDPGGRLMATSSIASLFGTARNEAYGASKSALDGLVRALAVELARYAITVNAVLPGYVETDMTGSLMANSKFTDAVLPRLPLRRFGQPEDFGAIAVYLMGAGSSYHTGDRIVIDGGYSAC